MNRWNFFLTIISIGDTVIPLDPKWMDKQTHQVLQDCSPDFLLFEPALMKLFSTSYRIPIYTVEDFYALPVTNIRRESFNQDAIYYIGYTSGTTGELNKINYVRR